MSLRDLAATIVDVLGLEADAPFPGASLARYWDDTAPSSPPTGTSSDPVLAEVVPGFATNVDDNGLPRKTWPLGALNDGDWSYIRREGNTHEELFRVGRDAGEQHNLARDPAAARSSSGCVRPWPGSRKGLSCRKDSVADDHVRRDRRRRKPKLGKYFRHAHIIFIGN